MNNKIIEYINIYGLGGIQTRDHNVYESQTVLTEHSSRSLVQ
jgi:hypothetical protein